MYTYNVAQRQRNRVFFEESHLAARTIQRNRIFEGKQENFFFNLLWKKSIHPNTTHARTSKRLTSRTNLFIIITQPLHTIGIFFEAHDISASPT